MNIFRRMLGSKIGGYFAVGFLGLIAIAFVVGDMSGSGGLDVFGPSQGEVATVGNQTLTINDLQTRTQLVFERMREERPELTMDQFLAEGGLRRVADELIATKALIAYGDKHGMRISKALVDAQIASNPAFTDATGNFSETIFRQMLAQQRVSEATLREDITGQLLQQQMLSPIGAGVRTPESMVPPYAAMLIEERSGELFAISSVAFAPKAPPSDAALQAFYRANPGEFSIPEQRRLRYATINLARFEAAATPTEAELADAYKRAEATYQGGQVRDLSQLILTTEAAARDAAAKAKAGQSLPDLARALGLSATRIDGVDQSQLATRTNADIAKAAFAAAKGGVVGPMRSPLGWAVLRVEEARQVAGKTLEQAKAELTPQVRAEKQKQLFGAFVNDLDGKLGEGTTLTDLAKAHGLTIVETPLVIKDGRALKEAAYQPNATVTTLLTPAFAMSADDDAQVVPIKPDEEAALLSVAEIVPAGPPPYGEVKAAVQVAWALTEGASKAQQAANQLAAELGRGTDPAAAIAKLGIPVQRQPLNARRADIANQQTGQIPPALEALFTIGTGKTKVLPADRKQGFMVVRLDKITPKDPSGIPQLLASTRAGLANVLGGEYARQFLLAVQKDLSVERNATAFAAVEKALREANGAAAAE